MSNEYPRWLFDEFSQVDVDYAQTEIAADYDEQHNRFRNFEEEARNIVAALKLSKDSMVLDMGCGTGQLAIHLAERCQHVYAVDASHAMIEVLKGKIEKQGLANVSLFRAGFLTYEHNGEKLDGIIANVSLHHLPDLWKQIALCRLYDILKPGGRLYLGDVVFNFNPEEYHEQLNGWISGMQKVLSPKIAEETFIHVGKEYSTWEWIMVGMLARAGFQIDSNDEVAPQMRIYVCSKKKN